MVMVKRHQRPYSVVVDVDQGQAWVPLTLMLRAYGATMLARFMACSWQARTIICVKSVCRSGESSMLSMMTYSDARLYLRLGVH
jgi:hypothetical protein